MIDSSECCPSTDTTGVPLFWLEGRTHLSRKTNVCLYILVLYERS